MNIILQLPTDLFNKTLEYYNPSTPSAIIVREHLTIFRLHQSFEMIKYGDNLFENGCCSICAFITHYMCVNPNHEFTLELLCRFFHNSGL